MSAGAGASAPRVPWKKLPPASTALADAPPSPGGAPHAGFRGPVDPKGDAAWAERLLRGQITSIRPNGGGKSLTLRVTFADGKKAVVKPRQKAGFSNHRAEIAAYHLDRLLGFGRTAVVVGRRLPLALVRAAAEGDAELARRMDEELVPEPGEPATVIEAALIAWHDGLLADATPPAGWKTSSPGARDGAYTDLLVFDALVDNTDRWSGGNVLSLGKDGPLIFLDNASAFLPYRAAQHGFLSKTLDGLCAFRGATLEAIGTELGERLGRSLAKDPLAPVIEPKLLVELDVRRAKVLDHAKACGDALVRLP